MAAWGTAHIHFSACNVILMTFAILCLLSKVKHVWIPGEETTWEQKVALAVGAVCSTLPSRAKLSQSLTAVVLLEGVDFQLKVKEETWVLKPPGFSQQEIFMLWPTFLLAWMHVINWNKWKLCSKHCPPLPLKAWTPPPAPIAPKCTFHLPDVPLRISIVGETEIFIYSTATRTYSIPKHKQPSFGKGHEGADRSSRREEALQGAGCRIPCPSQSTALDHALLMDEQEELRKRFMQIADRGETVLLLNHIFRYSMRNVNFSSKKETWAKYLSFKRWE